MAGTRVEAAIVAVACEWVVARMTQRDDGTATWNLGTKWDEMEMKLAVNE